MTRPQRYIGPELGALLREVRAELGDRATIHEANRIRKGGVAGFFRHEAFEVLASPPSGDTGADHVDDARWTDDTWVGDGEWAEDDTWADEPVAGSGDASFDRLVAGLAGAMRAEVSSPETRSATATTAVAERAPRHFGPDDLLGLDDEPPPPAPTPGQALLDRAESISSRERIEHLISRRRAGTPPPPRSAPALIREPIPALLAPHLELESEPAELEPAALEPAALITPEPTVTTELGLVPEIEPESAPMAEVDLDESHTPELELEPAPELDAPTAPSGIDDDFWSELAAFETLLDRRGITAAAIQLVVGPLDTALPIAMRISGVRRAGEIAVLTDAISVAGIETADLAETSGDLRRRIVAWQQARRPGVAIIEADGASWGETSGVAPTLPPRLLNVVDRVSEADGIGLIRLALRFLPPIDDVLGIIDGLGRPCVIDLGSVPDTALVIEAVERGVPIATVCGRTLTPALAMAMRSA